MTKKDLLKRLASVSESAEIRIGTIGSFGEVILWPICEIQCNLDELSSPQLVRIIAGFDGTKIKVK